MKKLMILGASYSQLPLYKAAADLGIATVAVSTPGDWPGFQLADECSYTDISDPEAVLEAAQKHKINGIATCCLERESALWDMSVNIWGLRGFRRKQESYAQINIL